jgi:hypothetical protein
MTHVEFFRLQAKNLFKDYNTKRSYIDEVDGDSYYRYEPRFFDINTVFLYYDVDEENFSLMKAQHLIALIVGFRKWTDLLKASEPKLELAKLLFDNQDKISSEDWEMYIHGMETDNKTTFDSDFRLEIFKQVFLNVDGHKSTFPDYRFNKNKN